MRFIDKSKKSNIKCDYCHHFSDVKDYCFALDKPKHYWNRCKQFEWADDIFDKSAVISTYQGK